VRERDMLSIEPSKSNTLQDVSQENEKQTKRKSKGNVWNTIDKIKMNTSANNFLDKDINSRCDVAWEIEEVSQLNTISLKHVPKTFDNVFKQKILFVQQCLKTRVRRKRSKYLLVLLANISTICPTSWIYHVFTVLTLMIEFNDWHFLKLTLTIHHIFVQKWFDMLLLYFFNSTVKLV
jgi:hypothetical protein